MDFVHHRGREMHLGYTLSLVQLESLGACKLPSTRQRVAAAHLLTAKMTAVKLAFSIPECPQQLLDYLQKFNAALPVSKAEDGESQCGRPSGVRSNVKADGKCAARAQQLPSTGYAGKVEHCKGKVAKFPRHVATKGHQQ